MINQYQLNYQDNTVEFNNIILKGSVIEIIAIGVGGISILDYQEFISDGETDLFLTQAIYDQTSVVLVTVDGIEVDSVFLESSELTDKIGKTIVKTPTKPIVGQIIKIICMGAAIGGDSTGLPLIRVNREIVLFDGSTSRIELDRFVNLGRASVVSSILVSINGNQLKGPDTIIRIYDGSNNIIILGEDPFTISGTIIFNNIVVYINNVEQPVITAYNFNTASKLVTVNPNFLQIGDEIKIIVDSSNEYFVDQNDIVLSPNILQSLNEDDVIEIIWFSEYPSFDIISDQYTGGQNNFYLKRIPLDSNYIWVYKNGQRLINSKDFRVDKEKRVVILSEFSLLSDEIKIVEFGNKIWTPPHAYEIFKDVLNINQYVRYSIDAVKLSKPLYYYSTEIEVTDGSGLFEPITSRNLPGTIILNGERIEYLQKNGNVLSQLRRGIFGTSIAEVYGSGTSIINVSPTEKIPYADYQDREDFVSDGSSLLIGPLNFVPELPDESKLLRNNWQTKWYKNSIPSNYGPCDQIEVFAGGRRLRKDPLEVYDENLGSFSPLADRITEAEFSVDGESPYIRLTEPVKAGTRIIVISKKGKLWYDRGENTASAGKKLEENTNLIASFIVKKSSDYPE
jgi:hypothetical protein